MVNYSDPSANYGWLLPDVGGDTGAWGTILNELFSGTTALGASVDGIDKVVKDISTVANAAMPKAGGTFTDNVKIKSSTYTTVNKGNITGNPFNVDLANGNYFYGTLTNNATIVFQNYPTSGDVEFWFMEITNGGAYTITWPSEVKWVGGSAPTLQSSGVDVLVFLTRDAGTNVRAGLALEATA